MGWCCVGADLGSGWFIRRTKREKAVNETHGVNLKNLLKTQEAVGPPIVLPIISLRGHQLLHMPRSAIFRTEHRAGGFGELFGNPDGLDPFAEFFCEVVCEGFVLLFVLFVGFVV